MPREAQLHDRLQLGLDQIRSAYGVEASIVAKDKLLDKFGYNPSLDTADGQVVVSNLGTNETLQTTNSITHVTAGSGDTHDMILEGHYLDGDGNLVFHSQTVTLDETNNVALTQPLARASRGYVPDGGIPTGPINVRIGSGGTSVLLIVSGDVQTEKTQTSLSYRDYWLILNYGAAVTSNASARVTCKLEFRPLFAPDGTAYTNPNWRPVTRRFVLSNATRVEFPQETPIIIPANSDVRMTASSTANSTTVTAHIDGYLAVDLAYAGVADPDPA